MIEVKNLVKVYSTKGGVTVRALDDVSVKFPEKGMVFLLGRSGSGKSTLLNVAGGLDRPDSGEVIVKGRSSKDFSSSDFDSYRNTCVGFVFQEYNILNEFTIEQNIALALQLQNKKNDKAAVNALLEQVDLKGFGKRKPNTLSGGQKQRVAIARALIKEPEIIMADEPTGALDSNTGKQVLDTLKKLSETKLVIIVSHDREFAEYYADRIIELKDGKILEDVTKNYSKPETVSENVQLVSEDTISVKNAENITEADVKNIVAMLKKNGGEAIITANKHELKDVKRACKINEDGSKESFKETKEVEIKEYDGKKTKFIKSRLPASHAFKIGASGLKTKPIRLIFTILLSVVAFAMFGIVSTFMIYDENYSISSALQEANYPTAALKNNYKYRYENVVVNLRDGTTKVDYSSEQTQQTRFAASDLAELNKNDVGLNFAGVFGLSDSLWDSSDLPMGISFSKNEDYYPRTSFCGFSDCGEKFLTDNGFTLKSGKYPVASDEIAVSQYADDAYTKSKNKSILGETLEFKTFSYSGDGTLKLKVVGVYDVGEIDSKYDELKNSVNTNELTKKEQENRQKLINSLSDMLKTSFYTVAFVSDDFYDANVSQTGNRNEYSNNVNPAYVSGIMKSNSEIKETVDKNSGSSFYTDTIVKRNGGAFVFYDKDGNESSVTAETLSLGETEIYAPYRDNTDYYLNALNYMYNTSSNNFSNMANDILNNVLPEKQSEIDYDKLVKEDLTIYSSYNNYFSPKDEAQRADIKRSYGRLKEVYDKRADYLDPSMLDYIENNYKVDFDYVVGNEEADVLLNSIIKAYKIGVKWLSKTEKTAIKSAVEKDYVNVTGDEHGFKADASQPKYYYKNYNGTSGEFTVKGYFSFAGGGEPYDIIVSDSFIANYSSSSEYNFNCSSTNYRAPKDLKYKTLITRTDNTQEQISFMLKGDDTRDVARSVDNEVYEGLQMFISLIKDMNKVFLIVGCIVGALAALMLLNFISASISAKRKEIGILRAVGARGTDVFKIFFAEAFIIAMICFVLASVIAGYVCGVINNTLTSATVAIPMSKLLDFNVVNVGLILAISLFVSAIATFFPVLSASKKPPVESIRAL